MSLPSDRSPDVFIVTNMVLSVARLQAVLIKDTLEGYKPSTAAERDAVAQVSTLITYLEAAQTTLEFMAQTYTEEDTDGDITDYLHRTD